MGPRLAGRRIPPVVPIVLATAGGVTATFLFGSVAFDWDGHMTTGYDGRAVLQTVTYAPLVLWGPLVLVVTWHYYRRRCRPASTPAGR